MQRFPLREGSDGRWSRYRGRIAVGALCLGVTTAVALLAAGVIAGTASALSPQVAVEHITSSNTSIVNQDQGWTNVASVSLTPGDSYVVFATVGLQTSSSDPGPISANCEISMPGEPSDNENADLTNTKGGQVANLSLEGVTVLYQLGGNISGSANLLCQELGNSGTPTGYVFAHSARIIAVPVDGATNNLGTLGCKGNGAATGAC